MNLTILLAYCINHSDSFHCILNEDKKLKCKEEKKITTLNLVILRHKIRK